MQQRPEPPSQPSTRTGPSFEIARGAPDVPFLILCDHATNLVPPPFGTLGLSEAELGRHIAYDIGAQGVAIELGRHLNATVISSRFSRLLIDPNRGEDDPTLIMQISDRVLVPGNFALTDAERDARISGFYAPYHGAISSELDAMTGRGLVPIVVSIHSFTEIWRGVPRPWHAAVLWDNDPRLALPLIQELSSRTGLKIGDNEPYSGHLRNDGIYRHATLRGLPNALVEIRQDLVQAPKGQEEWAAMLAECLNGIISRDSLREKLSVVEYHGSKTDITAIPK